MNVPKIVFGRDDLAVISVISLILMAVVCRYVVAAELLSPFCIKQLRYDTDLFGINHNVIIITVAAAAAFAAARPARAARQFQYVWLGIHSFCLFAPKV